jgi:hypothetical protein
MDILEPPQVSYIYSRFSASVKRYFQKHGYLFAPQGFHTQGPDRRLPGELQEGLADSICLPARTGFEPGFGTASLGGGL